MQNMKNDMTANELDKKVMEYVNQYDLGTIRGHLDLVGSGQVAEVENATGKPNLYYQWLACLIRMTSPKQVVELGAAAGISTIMMCTELSEGAKLYSVDNDPQAWRWMACEYKQLTKILGDDLNIGIWPEDARLEETDIWFFDSLHEEEQLRQEIALYSIYFKKGAILVFDDIHLSEGMEKVWNELPYDKHDISNPCHYSGFGVAVV
jgi:hypothetical protein